MIHTTSPMDWLFGDCGCCQQGCVYTGLCLQIQGFSLTTFSGSGSPCLVVGGAIPAWDGKGINQAAVPGLFCLYLKDGCVESQSGFPKRITTDRQMGIVTVVTGTTGPFGTPFTNPADIYISVNCIQVANPCTESELWRGYKSDGIVSPLGTYTRTGGTSAGPASLVLEACT